MTLVSVVVGIVELDADVACGVIRFPRNPLSENREKRILANTRLLTCPGIAGARDRL